VKNHQPVFYLFDFKEFVSLDLSPFFWGGGGHFRLKPWSCHVLPEVSAIGIDVGPLRGLVVFVALNKGSNRGMALVMFVQLHE